MKKIILFFLCINLLPLGSMAGTFTSNVASGDWSAPGSWTFVGDVDGVPDSDDDVLIQAGQTIIVSAVVSNYGQSLTVDGTLTVNPSKLLYLYGNYTINAGGAEGGSGRIIFLPGVGTTLSGAGTFSTTVSYTFATGSSRTVAAGAYIPKSATIGIANTTVTNNGTMVINALSTQTGATFTQGVGGTLTIGMNNFMAGRTFNASAAGNTVTLQYTGTTPTASANTFNHLVINGSLTQGTNIITNGNFTVNASRSLNMNGFNLTVGGNFTRTGTLTISAGNTITFNGTAQQDINASAATVAFQNVVADNSSVTGVILQSGTYTVAQSLTVNQGVFNVGTNVLTMLSDAASTARIGASGGTVTGSMTINRFISGRSAGYSDMASPLTGTTFTDWDNELLLVYDYVPNEQFPSCWSYSETAWDYVPVISAGTAITSGKGYMVYLDSDGAQTTFNATTVNSIGTPYMGDLDISGSLTRDNDGWNLVGNPYASFLDFNAYQTASAGTISGTWQYYDEVIKDFVSTSGGTIAPHQGFWIEVLSVPATSTFTESMKDPSNSSTFRSSAHEYFGLRLKGENTANFTSNTHFAFDNYFSENYEPGVDVTFIKVPHPDAPALYTHSSEGKNLRVNVFNKEEEWNIPVYCEVGKNDFYTISVQNLDFATADGYTCVVLEDKKTGTFTDLSNGSYRFFAQTGDEKDRFVLHLKQGDCKFALTQAGTTDDGVEISQQAEGVFVNFNLEESADCNISVYNPLGQIITEPVKLTAENQRIKLNVPADYSGIMIVSVQMNDKNITKKIFK